MFQPQPRPFSAFYSDFIPAQFDGLPYPHPHPLVSDSSFSSFLGASGGVDPGPSVSPGGPSVGHGGAVSVATPAGVSSTTCTFPLHGALPHPQRQPPVVGAPDLFDHKRLRRNNMAMTPDPTLSDDLAAQEAAARTWQPELEGPRVGGKTPINAITAEYAKADPVYVAKTLALPQTYTEYRPVKGDGNCGWRAIGFCYFELLIQQGSQELVQGEELRLRQLNDCLVNSGGYDPDMFMDFVEDTLQLFKDVSDNIHSPDNAIAVLTRRFNDDASMGILYHLRLLAGSWLKGHRGQYEAWCETGVDGYCASMIEPPEREIEELGIVLLVEILLKPVGFALEIAYLDRSAGTEVNTHTFPESSASTSPVMHLLYRPGHYDILYKPSHAEIQVNRMSFEPTNFASVPHYPVTFDFNPLAMVPGAGAIGPLSPMGQLGATSIDYSPSSQSQWFASPYADSSPTPPSQPAASQQASAPTSPMPGPAMSSAPTHEIRFCGHHYKAMAEPWPEQTIQTSMFKNSHFNKAHYNNPEFTPEEYKPGIDDVVERHEKPTRRKSHAKVAGLSSDGSPGHSSGKKRQLTINARPVKVETSPDYY